MSARGLTAHKMRQVLSALIAVTFVCFAGLYFLGLSNTGLFDVDEAIFAEASYEMIETGDYVTPHYNGEPRYHKPPLIYWLQAWSMDVLGKSAFAARLPSAVMGFLTVLGFYLFLSGMTKNARFALTASVVLGANLSFLVIAGAATADMALNFLVAMATLGFIASIFSVQRSPFAPWVLGAVLGLAMLAKGPVSLMVPTFVIGALVLLRKNFVYNLKCVHPVWVLVAMLVTLVPWVQFVVDAKGLDFFKEFILVHNVGRFTEAMGNTQSSSHFYYVGVLLLGFFPWVIFLPAAIARALKGFKSKLNAESVEEALPALGLVWFLSIFVFFSFSATKLPHYVLPSYAGAAIMIAALFEKMETHPLSKLWVVFAVFVTAIFSVLFLLFKFIPDLLLGRFESLPVWMQDAISYLQANHGFKIDDVEAQTLYMLSENVNITAMPFILGVLALVTVPLATWFVVNKKRVGVVVLGGFAFVSLLIISHSVVPSVYKYTQQPLANIGEKIDTGFVKGLDRLYFIAIHQPSVRFVGGVPFKSLSSSSALMQEVMPSDAATLWFVLKQERIENLKEFLPAYSSSVECEGGYCLAKVKMVDIRQHLLNR